MEVGTCFYRGTWIVFAFGLCWSGKDQKCLILVAVEVVIGPPERARMQMSYAQGSHGAAAMSMGSLTTK